MYVIEPRQEFNENNQQKLVKKTYQLEENIGWVMIDEQVIWSTEHKTTEEWFDYPVEGE